MYYSLQNYYDTRVDTIEVSENYLKLMSINFPKEGKDISNKDKDFNQQYNELKEKVN